MKFLKFIDINKFPEESVPVDVYPDGATIYVPLHNIASIEPMKDSEDVIIILMNNTRYEAWDLQVVDSKNIDCIITEVI